LSAISQIFASRNQRMNAIVRYAFDAPVTTA